MDLEYDEFCEIVIQTVCKTQEIGTGIDFPFKAARTLLTVGPSIKAGHILPGLCGGAAHVWE
jgi:hypothetical protein